MRPPAHNPFLTTRNDPNAILHRVAEFDRAAINDKDRTVEIAFSSEAPVERWFGTEVLGHDAANVRLGRLNNGGAVLVEHDRRDQVGVVVKASIDKDRKGRAVIRFGKSARAEEIFQDVKDGIRRLVSVGYRIHKQETKNEAGGVESVRVTDWEPYELSLVSIPADDSVGVGRGESSVPATSNNHSPTTTMNREQIMARLRALNIAFDESASTDALRSLLPEAERSAAPVITPAPSPAAQRSADPAPAPAITVVREDPAVVAQRAVEVERTRMSTITAIAAQARNQGIEVDAARAIADGITADAFRTQVFESLVSRQVNYQPGTPSRSEQRDLGQFSLVRGLRSLMEGRGLSGIELEMHQEAQREGQQAGIALRGQLSLPTVLLNHGRRDMTATGGSNGDQGGTTVATNLGSFIELLYAKMVIRGLGAQFLTGLVGNIDLPKLLTGSVPVKKDENTALAESSPTTGKVSLSPKRNGTYIEVSKQLLMQSSVGIEGVLRNDLATALALAMELGAINGGGSDEPTGILNTGSIGSVAGGTDGAAPTWAHIVALETAVAVANADMGSLGYLTNPKVRGKLLTTPKVASTDSNMVWSDGPTPLRGYRAEVTTQVPSTLTKGSSGAVCSAIIFGNFADLVIAQWGGIDISVNPYIKDIEGLVRITADTYYDAAVRRAGSFAAMKDALTA